MVTGAGSGVGKHTAKALSAAGFATVLVGRRKDRLEQTAAEFSKDAPPSLILAADVGDPAGVAGIFSEIQQRFGRLDVLFNNAGMGAPAVPIEDLTFEQWKA